MQQPVDRQPKLAPTSHPSADGSVIVGGSVSAKGPEAFRWTSNTGMLGLGDLGYTGVPFGSGASAVSRDGSAVVGNSRSFGGAGSFWEGFWWTTDGGMVALARLPVFIAYLSFALTGSILAGLGYGLLA